MCKVAEILMLVLLLFMGYQDWKSKQISGALLLGMTFAVALLRLFVWTESWWYTVGGIGVGLLFFIISKCSKEAVGYGDSWLILILGIFAGAIDTLQIVFTATVLCGIFSLFYCMKNGWRKGHTLPFVPFLAMAYMGVVFL